MRIEGFNEVSKMLDSVVSEVRVQDALGTACALVERTAKMKAPKDEGDLARSISSKVKENQGIVFSPLEYAPYVEYGTGLFAEEGGRKNVPWYYKDDEGDWHRTSGQRPQPYMRPALNENRERIVNMIKEALIK